MSENPYIGPRPFREGEKLPAREREQSELTDLLIGERVVLLHSPSGAGKTSVIQTGVIPLLKEERLGQKRFQPVSLRVKTPVPQGRTVHNRYVYSVALDFIAFGLLPGRDCQGIEPLSFPEVLGLATQQPTNRIWVLIFDQFEEILTLNPADKGGQKVFFQELGLALDGGDIWALFSMREDYIGGLEPFIQLPPRPSTREVPAGLPRTRRGQDRHPEARPRSGRHV